MSRGEENYTSSCYFEKKPRRINENYTTNWKKESCNNLDLISRSDSTLKMILEEEVREWNIYTFLSKIINDSRNN